MNDQPTYENEQQSRHIAHLIAAYVRGLASPEETAELLLWRKSKAANAQLMDALSNTQDLRKSLLHYEQLSSEQACRQLMLRISQHQKPHDQTRGKKLRIIRFSVAAVLAAVISGAALLMYDQSRQSAEQSGQFSQIILADGETLTLDSTSTLTASKTGIRDGQGKLLCGSRSGAEMLVLNTPAGRRTQITLSDGSRIWLNSASSLRFPGFFSKNIREVTLSGEAYFSVSHDQKRPFVVQSNTQRIRVLGTEFNLRSYPEEETKTTLLQGSVAVKAGKSGQALLLKPGEQSLLEINGSLRSRPVNTGAETAWKDGAISFDGKTFEQNMKEIARTYALELRFEGPPADLQLRGSINTGGSLAPVAALLTSAGIDFKLSDHILLIRARKEETGRH